VRAGPPTGAEGPGFKTQPRRCRVTVLGKLFTAMLVAALLRVARVTADLAESIGSLPPGLWFTSPAGWLPRTGISSGTLHSVIEYGLPLPFTEVQERRLFPYVPRYFNHWPHVELPRDFLYMLYMWLRLRHPLTTIRQCNTYVLPVLWMTSCSHTVVVQRRREWLVCSKWHQSAALGAKSGCLVDVARMVWEAWSM